MDNTSLDILVIILSVVLAVFLLLGIYLIFRSIQVVNHVKRVTEQAEKVANRAEHISDFFAKTATPVAIAKLIVNFTDVVNKRSKKKKGKEEE